MCGSGPAWIRCISVSVVTVLTAFLLSDCPQSPLGCPSCSRTCSILRQQFPQQTIALASNLPHPVSLDAPFFSWKTEWAVDVHWLFPWFHRSVFDPPCCLLFFQVQGFLLSIWYIWFLATGRWHWPTLVLRISSFPKSSFLEINLWLTCCTSTRECLNTNLIFTQCESPCCLTYVLFPSCREKSKKKKYFNFPFFLVIWWRERCKASILFYSLIPQIFRVPWDYLPNGTPLPFWKGNHLWWLSVFLQKQHR